MKKYLVILSLIVVMCIMTGCIEKIEIGPDNKGETSIPETKIQKIKYSFDEYLGEKKDGNQVKLLFDALLEENKNANEDEKISIELNALTGMIPSSKDAEKITKMKGYIGDYNSSYDVTYSGDSKTGKITSITVRQTVGTRNDPQIPIDY
ncbi:MAG: hypothetical protein IKI57_05090 [Clostridia bacterium]|nr:hypothetical protein [Clostridia bacterium]